MSKISDWDALQARKAYALEHYSEALNYMDEAPPLGYICANCGETTDAAGRFRKAEDYEVCDAEGDIYECGTCGSHMCLPPPSAPFPPQSSGTEPTPDSDDYPAPLAVR